MTRVGVFSDTHGLLAKVPAALDRAGALDGFLHLGDFGSDAERIFRLLPVPHHAVRGNCDYSGSLPKQLVVTFEGASLLLLHGDAYAYRGTYALALLAEENRCRAVLFGHTHTPLLAAQGEVLILNPGSLSCPRCGSAPSFAVLTIDGRDVHAKIITF